MSGFSDEWAWYWANFSASEEVFFLLDERKGGREDRGITSVAIFAG